MKVIIFLCSHFLLIWTNKLSIQGWAEPENFVRGGQTLALFLGEEKIKLEDLTVLKRSPDLLNNVKIGQDLNYSL